MIAAMLLAAVTFATAPPKPESGASLYATSCSSCHGAKGEGSTIAPPLNDKPAVDVHFMLDTGRMPAAVPNENEQHRTPAFSEQEIDSIVDYVMTFSNGSRALPQVSDGNVTRGRAVFAANCQQCHGAGGSGASVGFDNVAPSLMHATVFQVAEAIRTGPGVMPRFGPDVLGDQDVDDVARYVNSMQTAEHTPQGLRLGNVGPVAEGFVGWIGLGLLVLFVRKIGTTD